jgi:ubiquinone biosynthesis protein
VKSLQDELSFMTEGHNAEQIASTFEGHDEVVIPKVYWEWTRQRINVQDFVDGMPGVDLEAIDVAGIDRKRIAQIGASAALKMIISDGSSMPISTRDLSSSCRATASPSSTSAW